MTTKLLFFLLMFALSAKAQVTRGDTTEKKIALVFTGDEFADGGEFILNTLRDQQVKASFFLTGNFYRNKTFEHIVRDLISDGHYLGSHSDKHLLYCDWTNRDSLLVTKQEFNEDLEASYAELARLGIRKQDAYYFLPPFEWYNDSIVAWLHENNLELVNFTPGTRSTADYTYPEMAGRYVPSDTIYSSIVSFERNSRSGLNGFLLLIHIGTDPRRNDKFYHQLPRLLKHLKSKGYEWVRVDELLRKS